MGINYYFKQQPIYSKLQADNKKILIFTIRIDSKWSFDNRGVLLPINSTSSSVNGSALITLHITDYPSISTTLFLS